MRFVKLATSIAAVALLAACGGGDIMTTTSVRVAGDSLSDSGTFGFRFTVQGSATAPLPIWTEVVAQGVGVSALCARNVATSATTVVLNPSAVACTSHAVGGARINPIGTANDTTPFSVVQQLTNLAADATFKETELLLVNGGGNDLADLVGAFLAISIDNGAAYTSLLAELGITPTANTPEALAQAGVAYATALADKLVAAIDSQALSQGARRVVVLNAPDIIKTPRFQQVLAGVSATAGAPAAAQVAVVAGQWVQAFNGRLSSQLANRPTVAVVDFFNEFNTWIAIPANHGLTNTSTPACPVTGRDSIGLPTYSIQSCSAQSLSASPPAGSADANWWRTFVFSDNFHGTPKTNELMGNLVLQTLNAKGWR